MKFTKKIAFISAAIITLSLGICASADDTWQDIVVQPNLVRVKVNGTELSADNFLYNNTTYLPIRAVSEALNFEVAYDTSTSTASITAPSGSESYKGKKVMVLGDSNSALSGTTLDSEKADWKHWFSQAVSPSQLTCVAVAGATLCDKENSVYDGNPYYNADDKSGNTFGNQVQKIINNKYEAPDVIIILYGMNDGAQNLSDEDVEAAFMKSYWGLDPLPLSEVDRTTYAGAFRYVNETLRNLYPEAQIVACTPIQQSEGGRTYTRVKQTSDSIIKLARRMSLPLWDTGGESGIYATYGEYGTDSSQDLGDGLHTNGYGARKLGNYIASKFIQMCQF
jgi:lysophospholipase L1-like esterase